jgi:hypothetical protein
MFIRFRVFLPLATYILMSLYGSVLVSMLSIMDKSPGSYYQSIEEAFVGKILHKVILDLRLIDFIGVSRAVMVT